MRKIMKRIALIAFGLISMLSGFVSMCFAIQKEVSVNYVWVPFQPPEDETWRYSQDFKIDIATEKIKWVIQDAGGKDAGFSVSRDVWGIDPTIYPTVHNGEITDKPDNGTHLYIGNVHGHSGGFTIYIVPVK